MDKIKIADLEVYYRVGVSDEERAKPQRLLLTVDMISDFTPAAMSDRITKTIDYFAATEFLLKFGEEREWKLIEKLATNLADELLAKFKPVSVMVEVKKNAIPQAKYVSVSVVRPRRR